MKHLTKGEEMTDMTVQGIPDVCQKASDCRSEEGVIVGLIDGMIAQARVVARYLRERREESEHEEIRKALSDIRSDEDVLLVTDWDAAVERRLRDNIADEIDSAWINRGRSNGSYEEGYLDGLEHGERIARGVRDGAEQ